MNPLGVAFRQLGKVGRRLFAFFGADDGVEGAGCGHEVRGLVLSGADAGFAD